VMQVLIAAWLILATVASLIWIPQQTEARSARKLIQEAQSQHPNLPLYAYSSDEFSISYYTNGNIHLVDDYATVVTLLQQPDTLLITSAKLAPQLVANGHAVIISNNSSHALLMTKHE